MNQYRIGVVGGGLMGTGIALKFALAGFDTVLIETDAARIAQIASIVDDILAELIEAEVIRADQPDGVRHHLHTSTDLHALASVDLVIEAIPEVLAMKQKLYVQLETIVRDDAIIASNTSGFMPTGLSSAMTLPERFLIAHFWNPPHLIPLVEVVPGELTSAASVQKTVTYLQKIDAQPVVLQAEIPGFIGNRLQFALLREALHIVQSGAADAQTVDAVMQASLGRRYSIMGPLESADLGGLTTILAVGTHLLPELANDGRALDLLRQKVESGQTGATSGDGFHHWDQARRARMRRQRQQLLRKPALKSVVDE